jgi:Tol biopolymer transport system component
MSAILMKDPPDLSLTNQNISPGLERVVAHCLEKDPEQRFHSAHDLAFDLEALLGVSESGARPGAIPRAVSSARLPRAILPLAAAAAAIALVYGGARLAGFRFVRAAAATGRSPSGPVPSAHASAVFSQLTTQAGIENFPSISPDGKTFVYVSSASGNEDIYLQRVDGKNAINLTKDCLQDDTQPVFSPDGSLIAFRSERESGGIFVMGATGESVRRLTDFGFNPAWSPDGREIAVSTESILDPLSRRTTAALYAVNVATGAKRLVKKGDAVQPSWSPHGDRIAYWALPLGSGQRDIWTIPASGSSPGAEAVAVTSDAAVDWNPIWSPDGKFLYFSSDRNGTMNLWSVAIDEKSGRVLGNPEPMTVPSRWCGFLSISRDGRELLYSSRDETSGIRKVTLEPARERVTGEPVPILSGSLLVRDISPSPDGKWVAFTTRGAQENLFVISADGSHQRQLTNDSFKNRGPAWSPDGKRITFYSNRGGRYEIWSVNPDGSGLTQLTQISGPGVWFPLWSPDGTRLAFPDGTATYLFALGKPLGAEKPQPLPPFNDSGDAFLVTSWSPDGRALAGLVSRPDGTFLPGVVIYWLESKRYKRLTDFGSRPTWLSDSRRIVCGDPVGGKLLLLDSVSGRTVPLLDVAFDSNPSLGKLGLPLRDDRTIFFVTDHAEADIWRATLK